VQDEHDLFGGQSGEGVAKGALDNVTSSLSLSNMSRINCSHIGQGGSRIVKP
jgi:hypothetical protein